MAGDLEPHGFLTRPKPRLPAGLSLAISRAVIAVTARAFRRVPPSPLLVPPKSSPTDSPLEEDGFEPSRSRLSREAFVGVGPLADPWTGRPEGSSNVCLNRGRR